MQKYTLTVKPAISPEERHRIEDELNQMGYSINGGGTMNDMSECSISFKK